MAFTFVSYRPLLGLFFAAGVPFCRLLVCPLPLNFSFDASLHLFRLPLCVRLALIDLQSEEHVTFLSLGEHLNSFPQITQCLILRVFFCQLPNLAELLFVPLRVLIKKLLFRARRQLSVDFFAQIVICQLHRGVKIN